MVEEEKTAPKELKFFFHSARNLTYSTFSEKKKKMFFMGQPFFSFQLSSLAPCEPLREE